MLHRLFSVRCYPLFSIDIDARDVAPSFDIHCVYRFANRASDAREQVSQVWRDTACFENIDIHGCCSARVSQWH